MRTKKNLSILVLAFIIVGSILNFEAPQAHAFFPVIDIRASVKDIAIQIAQTVLDGITTKFVNNFVLGSVNKYGIRDYFNYGLTLQNQVYYSKTIQNQSNQDKFILNSLHNDLNGLPPQLSRDLNPLFVKTANDTYNITNITKIPNGPNVSSQRYLFLAQSGSPTADPAFLQASSVSKTLSFTSQAQAAAAADIQSGNGFKSSFNCSSKTPSNATTAQTVNKDVGCFVVNPGQFVSASINSKLFANDNKNIKPSDQPAAIVRAGKLFIGNVLSRLILNNVGSSVLK